MPARAAEAMDALLKGTFRDYGKVKFYNSTKRNYIHSKSLIAINKHLFRNIRNTNTQTNNQGIQNNLPGITSRFPGVFLL
ncbi:MAG: hypothetical protein MUF42_09520 [Cytophagaceae bacterium]|nr:hypothetical protein [Cytophagaceae bacterium]